MKKRKISPILIIGVGFILLSGIFMLVFQIRVKMGGGKCERVVQQMDEILPDPTPGMVGTVALSMPVLEIEGKDYCAMLEIPAFGVRLPVTSRWENKKLLEAPARFWGSTYNHSLVIGGSDFAEQFSFCDQIEHGTLVEITDMTGARFVYTVSRIDRAKHAEASWLQQEEFALTLFCRDLYTLEYVAVRCVSCYK